MSKISSLHLEIQKQGQKCYGLLRTTYWCKEEKKVKHKSYGRLSGLDFGKLKIIQAALQGEVKLLTDKDIPRTCKSKEYGASFSILQLAKELELDKAIYSKPSTQWVQDVLAMIAGRVVYAGSKLSLSNRYKDTALWELCGIEGKIDVDKHCYESMDYLLKRYMLFSKKWI